MLTVELRKKTSNNFHHGALNIIFFVHFLMFSIKTLKTLARFSKIFSPCSLPSLTQCSYPLLNKQLPAPTAIFKDFHGLEFFFNNFQDVCKP